MRRLMLAGLAATLIACESTGTDPILTAPAINVAPQAEVQVNFGSAIRLTNPDVVLRFVAVPEDSRCPINVDCVWIGDARIALTATGAVERSFELHFPTEQVGARKITLAAYEVEAKALEPAPVDGQPRNPNDYRVTLTIRRIAVE